MDGQTFIFVVISGLCFLPASSPRRYFLVEIALTWPEAVNYCREKYTDLASVSDEEQLNELNAEGQKYYTGHLWIGLYNAVNSWKWSLEKEGYYGDTEFRMWNTGEPNNSAGEETCVGMEGGGLWNDWACDLQIQFVCYAETAADSIFVFVDESATWSEAQSYCREHHTDLASVRSQAENDQIKAIIQNHNAWIGLYRDSWKWSDGSPATFTNWNPLKLPTGNINTYPALMHLNYWEENQWSQKLYFVCQLVPAQRQVLKLRVAKKEPSVNMVDAAEVVLQQFGLTLKGHGLSKDMKLAWRRQPDGKIFHLEEKEERTGQQEVICN